MGTHVRERESCIREFVMVEQASLRRRTESAIDALLALLDDLDSDPDLEPDNDDEPALGWPQDGPQSLCQDPGDDREGASWPEDVNQCRLSPWRGMASEDDEPSLGSTEKGMPFGCFFPMQTAAWGGLGHKGPSGDEPKRDAGGSQLRWAEGARDDAEGDEHDGREPEHDEPSLAAGEEADQTHWGEGRMMGVDLEDEHDGHEPDEDIEPDLGFRVSWRKACAKVGITDLTFNDLRGTAVTRLALAGCTEAEIATLTGHSLRDVRSILDAHYLARDPTLAENAIRKLEARTKIPD